MRENDLNLLLFNLKKAAGKKHLFLIALADQVNGAQAMALGHVHVSVPGFLSPWVMNISEYVPGCIGTIVLLSELKLGPWDMEKAHMLDLAQVQERGNDRVWDGMSIQATMFLSQG